MNLGVKTIIYPVDDIDRAKSLYRNLLDQEPYADESYYVGFKVGDQDIGLDPNAHRQGISGPVAYYEVDNIEKSLKSLVDDGAQVLQEIRDVGGGRMIASVKDRDGNDIGLLHDKEK